MANIEVKDIKSNGAQLFDDSEGFMDELNEDIFEQVNGGEASPFDLDTIYIPIDRPCTNPPIPIQDLLPCTPLVL